MAQVKKKSPIGLVRICLWFPAHGLENPVLKLARTLVPLRTHFSPPPFCKNNLGREREGGRRGTSEGNVLSERPRQPCFCGGRSHGEAWGRDFTRQPENSKRTHFRARAPQTPPKEDSHKSEERKMGRGGGGEGKKTRNVGPPPFGAPP